MAIIYNIPVAYSLQGGKENNSEIILKVDSIVRNFREAISRENLSYIVRRSKVGGSPSSLRHMEQQRKRRYIIAKSKERRLQKLKNNNR
ncbi:MAG: hypothetical protein U1E31_02080 [Rickettsiales bacterium]